jgi:hypothetical protein
MIREAMIQNTKDLLADTTLYEMMTTVREWRKNSDNEEVRKFSTQLLEIAGYLSSLRLDKVALQGIASEARTEKHKLDEQITKLISND